MRLKKPILCGIIVSAFLLLPVMSSAAEIHKVKDGETLWSVGQTYGISPDVIREQNQLSSNLIYKNQVLLVNNNEPSTSGKFKGKVTANVLNVRLSPELSSPVLATLYREKDVNVIETRGEWMLVTANRIKGWVSKAYISSFIPDAYSKNKNATFYVAASELNVRLKANITSPVRGFLKRGMQVQEIETDGEWTLITANNIKGWVMSQYLSTTPPQNQNVKTILLDAGHGGKDPGSIGYDGTKEKDLTLQLALRIQQKLIEKGYQVRMIRTDDRSCNNLTNVSKELRCRVQQTKINNADIYVSIHINSGISGQGTETYYNSSNPYPNESKKLAQSIHNHYQPIFQSINRGVKRENYYVIKHNTVPATLLEIGFITNIFDLPKMKDSVKQDEVAAGIASGIDEYFKN